MPWRNIEAFYDEIEFKKDGIIAKRARQVLDQAIAFLERIHKIGLFNSMARGFFAEVKRQPKGGKGYAGVIKRSKKYWNPFEEFLKKELKITR